MVVGIAGGYSHSGSSDLDLNSGWGGGYLIIFGSGFYLNQTAIAGGDYFSTTRSGLLGTARANSSGWFFSEVAQGGYNAKWNNLSIGPYAMLQYAIVGNGAFSETGSDAPVTVHSGTQGSTVSDLGTEASYNWNKLTFKLSLAWEHEYTDTTSFTEVNVVGIPSSLTTVAGTSLGHDSMIVNAGFSYQVTERASIGLGYAGQIGRKNEESNSIIGNIRLGF